MANPIKYTLATNILLRSEEFDNGSWIKSNISVTANQAISPSGLQDADLVDDGVVTSTQHWIYQNPTFLYNRTYTLSIFVKYINRKYMTMNIYNGVTSQYVDYDIQSGIVYGSTGDVTASIQSYGNSWYRIIYTRTIASTGSPNFRIAMADDFASETYTGSNKQVYLYGAQFELGSVATTYITTTASTVTVNATQSNSIKTSNFAIGVNKGGYGPTNITNFYNGKTANVGGYTVYVSNGSGSPSPFVASNDAALITLSNQLGGSGITTISAALNFFNASSTMLCTNMDYTNIVTSGLVLNLDAAYTPSFPKNGTTWKDLSGSGNNGTLVNGATYSSTDGGNIIFNGTSSYIQIDGIGSNNQLSWSPDGSVGSSSLCYEIWFKSSDSTGYFISKAWNGSGQYNYYLTPSQFSLVAGTGATYVTNITLPNISTNVWSQVVIWANSTTMGYYINGATQSGSQLHNLNGSVPSAGNSNLPLVINSLYPYGEGWAGNSNFSISGNTSIVRRYNRILSAAEVLQNYYAGLQRFIPTNGLVMSLDAENTDKRVSLPSVAYDMSGNNNNGTMLNSISLSTIGRTSFVLDGSNYQISATYSSTFDFSLGQTIILWLKPGTGATASRRNPYSQAYGGSGTITQETYSNFSYYFGTAGTDGLPYTGFSSVFTVVTNELAFIAVTRDQVTNTVNWYKNGTFSNTGNAGGYTTTNNGSLPIKIGTGYAGPFIGNIGQTFVYNRALTATEVSTIYTATKSRYGL